MKKQAGFTLLEMLMSFYFLVAILGGIGWVWNIVKIVGSDFAVITGMLIMRVIGVFVPPLGAVLGYF